MDDENLEDYNVPDVVSRFNALIDDQVNFTAGMDVMCVVPFPTLYNHWCKDAPTTLYFTTL